MTRLDELDHMIQLGLQASHTIISTSYLINSSHFTYRAIRSEEKSSIKIIKMSTVSENM
jgi:carbamoylphosphate synthase large subunit